MFRDGLEPRPGVNAADKARQRAFSLADSPRWSAAATKNSYPCTTQAKSQRFAKNHADCLRY